MTSVAGNKLSRRLVVVDVRMIEHSGIGAYLRGLLPFLLGMCRDFGIELAVVGPRQKIDCYRFLRAGAGKVVLFDAPIYSWREQLAFPRVRGASLYHFPHYNVPLNWRQPFVVTIHDLTPLMRPEFAGTLLEKTAFRIMIGNAARRAHTIFVPSPWVGEELIRRFHIPPERIILATYGIPPGWVVPPEAHIRTVLQRLRICPPYYFCVSIDKPHKNLRSLMEAFAILHATRTQMPGPTLVLAGLRPQDIARLRRMIDGILDQTLRRSVVLIDQFLETIDLAALYAGAVASVQPSWLEGFGLPVLEAQASGTPVIVPDLPWARFTAGDGALYYRPIGPQLLAEAMKEVLRPELRNELIARGRANTARFDWESTARRVLQSYSRALSLC